MSPTGSTQLVSSSVPERRLSTPLDGVEPCAIRLPQSPQNQPKRIAPASDGHSIRLGSPLVKANDASVIVTEQSVKAHDPDGWALLLDANGNLAEGMGCNVFIVREGKLHTPSERYVLPGVSRQMTFDLARKLGIPLIEGDIDLFDAANADEMFLTSTSLCIGAVRSFNGAKVGDGRVPGAVTKRLIEAYIDEVGCDFVQQYLDRLS